MKIAFGELGVIEDRDFRTAAMNMAIDEALLETVTLPTIRFYRWDHPALSFGYFGKLADVAAHSDRDCVRRWTGGGIVLHGDDLTYSLIIPASDPAFAESPMSIYESVHQGLREALGDAGKNTALAPVAGVADAGNASPARTAVSDRRYNANACFANPVRADLMLEGQKIAGAAQRKTKRGLLQQGSIQNIQLTDDFETRFAGKLSQSIVACAVDDALLNRAQQIATQKYGTDAWLRKR